MFGPIFCPDACCDQGGLFDFYGHVHAAGALYSDLFYRTGSVVPAGEDETLYSSIDEGWSVDYSPGDADDKGVIRQTIAAMDTEEEVVWALRDTNHDHPEGPSGDDISAALADWTEGTGADYDEDEDRLIVTTDAATADAYIEDGVTLVDGKAYRASIVAQSGTLDYLLVQVTETTAAHATREMLINLASHSGTGIDEANALEDGWYEYAMTFAATSPPGGAEFRIRLCSSLGGDVDADEDDYALVSSAALVPLDGDTPGWDAAIIDAEEQDLLRHVYLRRLVEIDAGNSRRDGGLSEHSVMGGGAVASRRAAQLRGDYESWGSEDRLAVADLTHGGIKRVWASDTHVAMIALQGDVGDNYDASDVLSVLSRSGSSDLRHRWGVCGWIEPIEYPNFEWDEVAGTAPCQYRDASVPNGGENFARIVACPPHDYPRVFGVLQPRKTYYTDSSTCPYDPGNAGPYGPPPASWKNSASVSQTAAITFGPWQRTTHEVLVSDGFPPTDVIRRTVPVLHGSANVWWSDTYTQTRLVSYSAGMEDQVTSTGSHGTPHVWCTLLMADSYPALTLGDGAGGIFVHGRATITIDETDGALPWRSWETGDSGPVENETLQTWLKVKLGVTTVFDEEIWRDAQAPFEGLLSAECMVHGVTAIHETEGDQDVDVRWVWFEALFSTTPTSSVTGVRSGWRMHVADLSGADQWTLDNSTPGDTPECYASSDRYFYVRGFTFCDSRLDGDRHDEWMFTHDGEYQWPVRKLVDGALDEPLASTKHSGNAMLADMIKNSDRLPLAPAYDQWPDREDVHWVDELLPPLADELTTGDSSYDAGTDRLTVDVATETDSAEVSAGVVFDHHLWHRFILEATADEATWLLVRFEDFGGAGVHLSAWLNVGAGTFGTTSGVRASPVKSVTDLGGGRYRFTFYAEVAGSSSVASTVVVRLVDGNGDENIDAAAAGDGLLLHSWSLSSDCAEFAP